MLVMDCPLSHFIPHQRPMNRKEKRYICVNTISNLGLDSWGRSCTFFPLDSLHTKYTLVIPFCISI